MRKLKDKKKAAELWLNGKLGEEDLKRILSREEMKDLKFGKSWVEEMVESISPVQSIKT